jgi:serine O-acetyltransferase
MGGDTVIGAGSTIGGSVFLTHSVPEDSLVVLEATNVKVIPKKSRESYVLDYQI